MKTVYPNDEIPHLWAHQTQSHARGAGSISFRDGTGYSYAAPICRHAVSKDRAACILFTTLSHSVTTAKHIGQFRAALPYGVPVYHVRNVMAESAEAHKENVRERDESISYLASKVKKSRAGSMNASNLAESLSRSIANRNAYALAFRVRVKPLSHEEAATLSAKLEKEAAQARKRSEKLAKEREAREEAEYQTALAEWLAGTRDYVPHRYGKPVYLRVNPATLPKCCACGADALCTASHTAEEMAQNAAAMKEYHASCEMETSQGARVPLTHARRAVKRVAAVRAAGTEWHRNGQTLPVGHYHIDSISATGDVVAGCHRIAWEEIERFATAQGWL